MMLLITVHNSHHPFLPCVPYDKRREDPGKRTREHYLGRRKEFCTSDGAGSKKTDYA